MHQSVTTSSAVNSESPFHVTSECCLLPLEKKNKSCFPAFKGMFLQSPEQALGSSECRELFLGSSFLGSDIDVTAADRSLYSPSGELQEATGWKLPLKVPLVCENCTSFVMEFPLTDNTGQN